MSRLSRIAALALLLAPLCVTGCGPGENEVIQPGEDYQLTPEEQANKDAEMEARKGAGGDR